MAQGGASRGATSAGATPPAPAGGGSISLLAAICIGIGGMVGAGIFSILGVVADAARNAMWLSFVIGGVVALLSTYSYAKLGARYPSAGGAVEFLVQGFGDGVLSGGLNLYMWIGYVIALALYASGFAGYGVTFFPGPASPELSKGLAIGVVLLFTVVNWIGAKSVGRSETFIVVVKLAILGVFSIAGMFYIQPSNLSPELWPAGAEILFGAGVLFIGYEGFGLITNAAEDMRNPQKMLPRALYLSVVAVIGIYLAVSVAVLGNLSVAQIKAAEDYALAEAAKPFLGEVGFKLIAIGALFSTASAINATLFGGANVSYMLARDGQLPTPFERQFLGRSSGGLIITAALVILFLLFFDLSGIAMMGSGAFLLIYAAVNAGHLRLTKETGANPSLVWLSIFACLAMFAVLSVYIYHTAPPALYTMVALLLASFAVEWAYRRATGRKLQTRTPGRGG
jgi:amino acid transporter